MRKRTHYQWDTTTSRASDHNEYISLVETGRRGMRAAWDVVDRGGEGRREEKRGEERCMHL
jgi:hypothetical protein